MDEFFETDESPEVVVAAFEAGDKQLTAPRLPAGAVIVVPSPTYGDANPRTITPGFSGPHVTMTPVGSAA